MHYSDALKNCDSDRDRNQQVVFQNLTWGLEHSIILDHYHEFLVVVSYLVPFSRFTVSLTNSKITKNIL